MSIYLPSLKTIHKVFEDFPDTPEDYLGMNEVFKVNTTDFTGWNIRYWVLDGIQGMTAAHALGTDPVMVSGPGWKEYSFEPLAFKQTMNIGEKQILTLADMRDDRQRFSVNKWVADAMSQQNAYADTRIEASGWEAVTTGHLVIDEHLIKCDIDYGIPSGNKITVGTTAPLASSALWSVPASATPVDDVMAVLALLDGLNVDTVKAYSNKSVARLLAKVEQVQDRLTGTADLKNLTEDSVAMQFAGMTTLDSYKVYNKYYNKYYTNSSNVRTPFIANNKLVLIAEQRKNGPTVEWASVPSLHRGTMERPQAGKFVFPDFRKATPNEKNPKIEITGGVNGAPYIPRPKLIFILTVA